MVENLMCTASVIQEIYITHVTRNIFENNYKTRETRITTYLKYFRRNKK